MNPVQLFISILAIVLVWHGAIQADECNSLAPGSLEHTQCSACKFGNQTTECLHAGDSWCNSLGARMCGVPNCLHMPACKVPDVNCTKVAGGASDYWAYINQCDSCETKKTGQNVNTVSCSDGAKEWCKSNCSDSMCKTTPECGGEGIKSLLGGGLEPPRPDEAEECRQGQTTKKDGTPCPAPARALLMGNTKNAAQANAAAQNCEALKNKAQQDCQAAGNLNPAVDDKAAMNALCEAYKNGNLANFQQQLQFGDRCGVSYMECKNRCTEGAGEFGQFLQQSSQMRASAQTCQGFSTAVSRSGSSGLASLSQAEVGRKCDELTASRFKPQTAPGATPPGPSSPSPSSPGPGTQQPGPSTQQPDQAKKPNSDGGGGSGGSGGGGGDAGSPASRQNSSYNSNSVYGNGAGFNPTQQPKEQGADPVQQGGFRDPEAGASEKDFNVADSSAVNRGYTGNGEGGAPNMPGGQGRGGGGGVPNNTGGSIPGSDGGAGARLGPQNLGGAPQRGGSTTDIMQGFQGGGGYSSSGGGGSGFDSDGRRFQGGANRAQARAPAGDGIDLRNYLPGGSMDPGRRAGGFRPTGLMDINGAHVNIWIKVGDRLRERCRLGRMFDCG